MKNANLIILDSRNISTAKVLGNYSAGKFRFVVKVRAGFLTVCDARDFENERYLKYPESIIADYKKNALQTVQFKPEGSDYWLTVFAKKGKTIPVIDELILANLTVGTINSCWLNTALYNHAQYTAVKAKTWASKAFVMNEVKELAA